jgi:ribosome-binding protein aMBF1 (putative translation factor)
MSTVFVGVDKINFSPYFCVMLSPEQSRAARAWLDWSQDDLAKRASVALSTVRDFEKGRRTPIANNLEAIKRVLAEAGIELLFDDADKATGIAFKRA